jgi:hypothetical protein
VVLDHGQFYLLTGDPDFGLIEEALGADGIAQSDGMLVVLSPHQNNFSMRLRVEVWTGAPPNDLEAWPEASIVHLDVGEAGLIYTTTTWEEIELGVAPGSYRALITGRGFLAHGWPGSTHPGDEWRIQLWNAAGPDDPISLQRYAPRSAAAGAPAASGEHPVVARGDASASPTEPVIRECGCGDFVRCFGADDLVCPNCGSGLDHSRVVTFDRGRPVGHPTPDVPGLPALLKSVRASRTSRQLATKMKKRKDPVLRDFGGWLDLNWWFIGLADEDTAAALGALLEASAAHDGDGIGMVEVGRIIEPAIRASP